jgi:hypothetical protein
MDIPAPDKIVVAGPELSVAAQVATNVADSINLATGPTVPDIKPVDVVDRDFVESIGVKTHGWLHAGKTFWKEHSTQFWTAAITLQTYLLAFQGDIPEAWEKVSRGVAIVLGVLGVLMKLRLQPSIVVERVRSEVKEKTE